MAATGFTSGDPRKLNRTGYTKGDLVAADTGGQLTPVPVGANTEVLTADDAVATGVTWTPGGGGGGGTPANTVVSEISYGQSSSPGAATTYSRGDHTHGTPPLANTPPTTTLGIGSTGTTGVATSPARADHTHPVAAAGVPTASAPGDVQATGVASTFAASDHRHARESFGTTAGTITEGNDSRVTGAQQRSTLTTLGDIYVATGAATVTRQGVGADGEILTADSVSPTGVTWAPLPPAPTVPDPATTVVLETTYGLTAATGTSLDYARADHTHGTPSLGINEGEGAEGEALPLTTGVVFGGELNINAGDSGSLDVGATIGYVVDYTTTPETPTYVRVETTPQTVALIDTVNPVTWWLLDVNGNVVQQSTKPTFSQRRTHIVLGYTEQVSGDIVVEQSLPVILTQPVNQLYDLMEALGPFNIEGNTLSPGGANLTVSRSAGSVFNASYHRYVGSTLTNSPHVSPTDAINPAYMRYYTQTDLVGGPPVTGVDAANYDNGGVITPVGGSSNSSTIQQFYFFPHNNPQFELRVQYGQTVYPTLNDAVNAIEHGTFVESAAMTDGILLGYLCVQRTATNLSNASQAQFVDSGKFGGVAGGHVGANAATSVVTEMSYGQSATAGVGFAYARGDHTHGTPSLTNTAPGTTLGIGQAASVGVATTPARADHVHPLAAAGAPVASAPGDTQSTGAATTFAASDHRHAREVFGTTSGTVAEGNDARITGAQQRSTLTTKGDIYVATASATTTRLAAGTDGYVLRADSTQTEGLTWTPLRQTETWSRDGAATITTGALRWYNRTGVTLTIHGAWAAAGTAPTGADIIVDVNRDGTTIFTTQANRPTIPATTNAGTLATPDVTTLANGSYLTVDIDQIGSTIAGSDITVGVVMS